MTAPRRRLALASAWMIVATGVINVSMVVFHHEMSKRLGTGYADLSALLGVLNLSAILVSGAATTMTRGFAAAAALGGVKAARRRLAGQSKYVALAALALALSLSAGAGPIADYLHLPATGLYYWVVLLAVLGMLMAIFRSYVQGLHAFWIFGAGMIVEGIGRVVFSTYFAAAGYGVQGAIWGSLAAVLLAILACLPVLFVTHTEGAAAEASAPDPWGLLRDTAALGMFSLLCFLDVFVVKHNFSDVDAGSYTRVALAGKSFLYLASAINLVALPAFAAAFAKGEDARHLLGRFLGAMLALLVLGWLVLCWQTDLAIRVLLGSDEFLGLAPLIRAFAAAVIPLALLQLLISYLLAAKRRRVLLLLGALTLSYALLLNGRHQDTAMVIQCLALVAGLGLAVGMILAFSKFERSDRHAEKRQ